MMISVEPYGQAVIVTPRCDLDLGNKEAFVTSLETAARQTEGKIVVSMLHCDYLDSTALSALATAQRTFGKRFVLAMPPDARVARVFTITGFHKVVPIFPTLDEALGGTAS